MKNILFINDNKDIMQSLESLTSDFFSGFSIYTATNGMEGIELARTHLPDVILIDIAMTGMDSFEVCKILKEDENLCNIPVIFITALQENKASRVRALEVGAEGFLSKPIDEIVLFAQIKAMLKIKKASDSQKSEKQRLEKMVAEGTGHLVNDLQINRDISQKLCESEKYSVNKLKTKTEPDSDIESLNLADVIESEGFQILMENFYKVTHIGGAIVDISGKVLVAVGWQDICTKFHRVHPDTVKNCLESDLALANGIPVGTFKAYRCKNNMWDMASPIEIGGKHLGNIYFGQFFYDDEHVDYELFRKQARQYGFDETEYLAALVRVPRFKRELLQYAMTYYARLAVMISSLSHTKIKLSKDISQRKKAEATLQEKNDLLERVFDSNFDLIALTDLEGNYTLVGKSHEVMGYDRDSLIGKNVMGFVHPEDVDIVRKEFAQFLKFGKNRKVEYRYKRIDGEYLWFETIGTILSDEKGKPEQILFNTRNITERKQAEEKLRESEVKFRSLAENTSDVIAIMDLQGTITYMSLVCEKETGYKKSEVEGTNIRDLLTPESYAVAMKRFQKRLKGENINAPFEVGIVNKTGKIVPFELNTSAITEGGKIKRIQIIARNLTERKKAEESLREGELVTRALLDGIPESAFLVDIDGTVIEVNKTVAQRLKKRKKELIGSDIFKAVPQDVAETRRIYFDKALKTRNQVQFQDVRYDRIIDNRINPIIDSNGKISRLAVIGIDITERMKIESELKEKTTFLSTIMKTSPVGIVTVDKTGNITYANNRAEEILGLEKENLTSTTYDAPLFNHTDLDGSPLPDEKQPFNIIKKTLKTVLNIQHGITWPDGTLVILSINATPIKDNKGHFGGMIASIEDISERKQAEEKLRESETGLREAQRLAKIGSCLFNPHNGKIIMSDELYGILGLEKNAAALDLKNHQKLYTPESWQRFNEEVKKALETGEFNEMELEIIRKTGNRFVLASAETLKDKTGKFVEFRGTLQDITERKLAEDALRESEKHNAFLAQTAFELVKLTSIQNIYKYTVQKLHELLNGNSIIALVEYDQSKNRWKMQQIEGVGEKAAKLSRLLGFDIVNLEGDISTKYYEKIISGKLTELDYDFPGLFNNKVSASLGKTVKKMFSVEKLYCIAFQEDEQIIGNITFSTNKNTAAFNTNLIETFIQQVSIIIKEKKIEKRLKDSEMQKNIILNSSQEIFSFLDLDLNIIWANKAAADSVSLTQEELIGKRCHELFQNRQVPCEGCTVLKAKETKKAQSSERVMPDGKIWSLRAYPVLNEQGEVVNLIEFAMDITQRKQAEEKIHEKDIQFRKLSANVPDLIYQFTRSPDGSYYVPIATEGIKNIFGCQPEEVADNFEAIERVLHPEDAKRVINDIEYSATHLSNFVCEFRVLIPGKPIQWILSRSTPEKMPDGSVTWYGFNANITDRKRAETVKQIQYKIANALIETEDLDELFPKIREYLGLLIDTKNFYIAIYNAEKNSISFHYHQDVKDEIEELPAAKSLIAYVIHQSKPVLAQTDDILSLKEKGLIETIGTPSKVWLGVPLKIENKIIGVVAVKNYEDENAYTQKDIEVLEFVSHQIATVITKKQNREELRHAYDQLIQLNKDLQKKVEITVQQLREKDHMLITKSRQAAMGEMIGNIAHHWRQPLTAVSVILQNIEDAGECGELDAAFLEKNVFLAMEQLQFMSRTIDNFRNFFKSNKEKANFNAKESIEKIIGFISKSFERNQIELETYLENVTIFGFGNEYSQVVLNILNNAKDAILDNNKSGGKVKIELKEEAGKGVLKICDSGGGIPPKVLDKIFDPYFTTKEQGKGKGIGIGLYMSKMIIENNMDGSIEAHNFPEGACFIIIV
jgi:PAS domain S-box-containing protein